MSVIAYEYSEFEGVYNQMVKVPELQKIVMNNDYVKRYNSRQMPVSMKYKYEDALGRLFWYMYVANRVAYSLQYQRNEDIFTPEVTAEKYTLDEAKQKFGSFMYNIYTNNGTVFLSEDWLGLAEDIKKFIHPKDFAKGGEVKFDEDYYGYSAKVPYLNETYLVEFGKNPNPPYDSVNISDRSFRIVDKNSSTAKNIYNKMLKEKAKQKPFNNAFADGGTLPTPFGQAGLVGETGAMNEIDLFAMGGGLPQGVQQYYGQTYNPAYPTPHGYAKGGKTQGGKFADGGRVANYKNSVELYYNDGRKDSTSGVSTKHDKFLLVSENRLDEIKSKDNYYNGFWQYPNKDIPPVPVLVLQKNERSNDLYAVPLRNYEAKDIMEFGGNYVGEYFLGAIGLFDRRNLSGRDADDISSYNQGTPRYAKGGKTQGYNDKLDESLGNTKGKRSTKEQNYKDRRNESEAMEKKEGQRKYARVKTMDKNRRKRKTPMTLAKEIRKEGEKWVDAVKRASKMMKNK